MVTLTYLCFVGIVTLTKCMFVYIECKEACAVPKERIIEFVRAGRMVGAVRVAHPASVSDCV